jgi:hypothetical protein
MNFSFIFSFFFSVSHYTYLNCKTYVALLENVFVRLGVIEWSAVAEKELSVGLALVAETVCAKAAFEIAFFCSQFIFI